MPSSTSGSASIIGDMGIRPEMAAVVESLNLPKGFSVCELGDQTYTFGGGRKVAAGWYLEHGAGRYESIDGNGRGTVTWDLNRNWSGKVGQFDLVTDFGTGEHIFNQAAVWRTLHLLVKVDGYIVFDRPSVGYPEHCYYNSHKCLFDDLAKTNEYRVVLLKSAETTRGLLWCGVWQKVRAQKFRMPQQGRYRQSLQPILG